MSHSLPLKSRDRKLITGEMRRIAAHHPRNAVITALLAPPPRISYANNDAASANGLIPADRIAETWVVGPGAAIAKGAAQCQGIDRRFGDADGKIVPQIAQVRVLMKN
jgi:hypothetical protein